jgi:hypothetical protein
MHYHIDQHAITSRLFHLAEELCAGCDQDFDAGHEELEREFAELRLAFGNDE